MIFLILFNIFKKVSVSKQFRILSSYQNIILRLYCMCSNDPFKYLVSCQFAIFIKRADEFSPIIRACKLFIESMSSNFFYIQSSRNLFSFRLKARNFKSHVRYIKGLFKWTRSLCLSRVRLYRQKPTNPTYLLAQNEATEF